MTDRHFYPWSKGHVFGDARPEVVKRGLIASPDENLNIAILNRSIADVFSRYRFIPVRQDPNPDQRIKFVEYISKSPQFYKEAGFGRQLPHEADPNQLYEQQKRALDYDKNPLTVSHCSEMEPFDLDKIAYRVSAREELSNMVLAKTHFSDNRSGIAIPLSASGPLEIRHLLLADSIRPYVELRSYLDNSKSKGDLAFEMLNELSRLHVNQNRFADHANEVRWILGTSDGETSADAVRDTQSEFNKIRRLMNNRNITLNAGVKLELDNADIANGLGFSSQHVEHLERAKTQINEKKIRSDMNGALARIHFGMENENTVNPLLDFPKTRTTSEDLAHHIHPFINRRQEEEGASSREAHAYSFLEDIGRIKTSVDNDLQHMTRPINRLLETSDRKNADTLSEETAAAFIEISHYANLRDKAVDEEQPRVTWENPKTEHPWQKPLTESESRFLSELTPRQQKIVLRHKADAEGRPDMINYLPPLTQQRARIPGEIAPSVTVYKNGLLDIEIPRYKGLNIIPEALYQDTLNRSEVKELNGLRRRHLANLQTRDNTPEVPADPAPQVGLADQNTIVPAGVSDEEIRPAQPTTAAKRKRTSAQPDGTNDEEIQQEPSSNRQRTDGRYMAPDGGVDTSNVDTSEIPDRVEERRSPGRQI